ncbi:MAG TPA: phenylalanine--tRNA ligase subunit beta [Thermoanaerobaculia bacterium]|nr:phenylalanine--tRNA ligase subunit beta [Thermoanaerobaculia bacterium]
MLFSTRWLADYVDLPEEVRELARRLTAAGHAVEGIEEKGDDVLLDVEVTTNRPDCMNHLGLAREIAVLFGRPLRVPPVAPPESAGRVEDAAAVEVEEEIFCPRFVARVVRGVKVQESPAWLRDRLASIGLRSISNVVDVTNFILWEMGQPLHAYDLDRLSGRKLLVRLAHRGERLTTLDGVDRELDEQMLVIADAERAVGLAGVMGGLDSEVTERTRDVLIEGAHFHRQAVRIAARKLGMHTDASHRFERGADPEICERAVSRAAQLLAEIAGGTVLAGAIDARGPQDESAGWPPRGRLELAKLNAFAGAEIPRADVERWLTGLGFTLQPAGPGLQEETAWDVTVPSWRYYDFRTRHQPPHSVYPQDLYEEVLRMYGFDNIAAALPGIEGSDGTRTPEQSLRERARDWLAAAGYAEAVNFAFQSRSLDGRFPSLRPGTEPLELANPLSEAYSVLRRSMVPNLVENARFNQRRGVPAVRLFEIGRAFFPSDKLGALPDQPEQVGLVCGGRTGTPWQREAELDLFDLKGAVDGLAEELGVRLEARPAELTGLLEGHAAELVRPDQGGRIVGWFGRVEEEEGYPLYVAEIALDGLAGGNDQRRGLEVALPSRFPGIDADFTLTHALNTPWAAIDRGIAEATPADLVSWNLKDRYRGPGVPEGAVNTTITFLYNSQERSLTQDEVNERQDALTAELARRFGWRS